MLEMAVMWRVARSKYSALQVHLGYVYIWFTLNIWKYQHSNIRFLEFYMCNL